MEFQRYFSRDEASHALPLVRRIVADILQTGQDLRSYLQKISPQKGQLTPANPKSSSIKPVNVDTLFEDDPRALQYRDTLLEYLKELESMGCFFKDWNFEIGLVDFPSIIDGEQVFLCWRSDEPTLAFFHRVTDGYSGRQPLPP
jgi:hypothetical protein